MPPYERKCAFECDYVRRHAKLESVLGSRPRGFESRILRHSHRGNAEADPPRPALLAAPANARANTALGIAWIAPRPRPRRWPRRPTAELENIPYRADGSGELTRVLLRSVMTRVEIAVVHQLREMGLVLHSRPRRVNSVVPAVEDDGGHIDLR